MQLRDFVPPIVVQIAKRSRSGKAIYDSYEAALEAASGGYEHSGLVDVIVEKIRRYRDLISVQRPFIAEAGSLRTLIGLSLAKRGEALNVIDFGGAGGTHYFIARMAFGESLKLRWHVVETPAMVSKAASLQDGQLRFFDQLHAAQDSLGGRVDLVFSSGALQYVPRPYDFLERLTECRAENLFITRVGLTTLPRDLVTVQESRLSTNGPGALPPGVADATVLYPVTFASKDKFEAIIRRNYSIEVQFHEDRDAYRAAHYSIDMFGYFARLKPDA